ncbi:MAG TPA: protein kinase, partial [Chlamydiales bacterium]|nr:protein kinase [Chlamydiales bacterium]
LSLAKILNITSQWLDGLATISEQGIHGDLHPRNLLLRGTAEGIEGVIADFGTYRSYEQIQHGLTTLAVAPPEYYAEKQVTSKQDVWALGISLLEMCSKDWLPCWLLRTEQEMGRWTSELSPGWSLKRWTFAKTPPFLVRLINEMLDPCLDYRPTAKEAFERFSASIPENE